MHRIARRRGETQAGRYANHDDERPDEPRALAHGRMRAERGAGDLGDAHGEADAQDDMAGKGEGRERRNIGGEIGDFRMGGRAHDAITQEADEAQHIKRAGARSEQAVIGADQPARRRSQRRRAKAAWWRSLSLRAGAKAK